MAAPGNDGLANASMASIGMVNINMEIANIGIANTDQNAYSKTEPYNKAPTSNTLLGLGRWVPDSDAAHLEMAPHHLLLSSSQEDTRPFTALALASAQVVVPDSTRHPTTYDLSRAVGMLSIDYSYGDNFEMTKSWEENPFEDGWGIDTWIP